MADVIHLKKDSHLFLQGDNAEAMYIIKTGEIGIFVSDYMVEKMISKSGPGELIGEMSLFDKLNRSATAIALTDAEVVVLPYRKLNEDLSQMPEWVQITLKTLTIKIRMANTKYLNEAGKTNGVV